MHLSLYLEVFILIYIKRIMTGWKPITLRWPVLLGLIVVSAEIIIVLEILSHMSTRDNNKNGGGLAFAVDVKSLSTGVSFWYNNTP